eukprot:scaffold39796_cov139-Skeletonema_dohrnii-CCMP3373.AAC.1
MLRYDDWDDEGLVHLSRERPHSVDVATFAIRENDDCGWLGYFIGKSQKLENMFFDYFPQERERVDAFMVGFCHNQSIQRIDVDSDIGEAGFRELGNFLGNNRSVRDINFFSFDIGSECAQNIALMFGQSQYKSLKHIHFSDNNLHDEESAQIAAALVVQPQIEELIFYDNINIGRLGGIALGSTLKIWRAPSLKKLSICISEINDECIQVMAAGMINCSSLSELNMLNFNLGGNLITEVGLKSFSDMFQTGSCCMEKLHLSGMNIGFDGAPALAAGLSRCRSLKSLDLSNNILGDAGLDAIVAGLANSSNLEELELSCNGVFSSAGLGSLATLFRTAENSMAVSLAHNGINDEGLQALSEGVTNQCNVTILDLSYNTITDEGVQALASGLINNSNLEILRLSGHGSITAAGLRSLSAFFQSESCALKEFWLHNMSIGDDGASALADGLVGNKSLEELRFCCDTSGITDVGWSAFSKLLCDTSSVNNTYLSNHTLELIGNNDTPTDIAKYLQLKQVYSVSQVEMVKVKVIMSHPHLNMEPFFPWRLKFLPLVVAYFDAVKSIFGLSETGQDLSIVYQFVRGMPLFVVRSYAGENVHRKRKRDVEREA